MSTSKKNKNSWKSVLNSSWEIWDFLVKKAGLDLEHYDLHIAEELCKGLGISLPCKGIKEILRAR